MMTSAVDKQLRVIIRTRVVRRISQWRIVGVVADVKPHIVITVDMCQALLAHVIASVLVDHVGIRTGWDLVIFAWRESPGAPLLGVLDCERIGDQGWAILRRDLVRTELCAGRIEVRALAMVMVESPICLVLSAEAFRAVDWRPIAKWDDVFLDVVCVIAEIIPRLPVGHGAEFVVDLFDTFGRIRVGDVPAEVPEVI